MGGDIIEFETTELEKLAKKLWQAARKNEQNKCLWLCCQIADLIEPNDIDSDDIEYWIKEPGKEFDLWSELKLPPDVEIIFEPEEKDE